MARHRGKINVVCQNKKCTHFGKETNKDIIKKGKNRAGHKQYYCLHCRSYFVETKGTPLYQRKLGEKKIKQLCKELVEKKGIRAVERTIGIHRDTIGSYLSAFSEHATSISKYLTKNLELSTYEVDEFWSFVKKNKRKLTPLAMKNLQQVTSGVML